MFIDIKISFNQYFTRNERKKNKNDFSKFLVSLGYDQKKVGVYFTVIHEEQRPPMVLQSRIKFFPTTQESSPSQSPEKGWSSRFIQLYDQEKSSENPNYSKLNQLLATFINEVNQQKLLRIEKRRASRCRRGISKLAYYATCCSRAHTTKKTRWSAALEPSKKPLYYAVFNIHGQEMMHSSHHNHNKDFHNTVNKLIEFTGAYTRSSRRGRSTRYKSLHPVLAAIQEKEANHQQNRSGSSKNLTTHSK